MDPIILAVLLVGGFILLALFLNKKINDLGSAKPSDELLEYLKTTNVRLDQQGKSFNERLDNAARVIGDVQKNIGEMSEIGRGMKELQEFLRSPKIRGNMGESILKEMLGQYLPKASFNLQYTFKSGEKVDAAIKYILTEEGTIDYALMYVPNEAIYYEIVNNQNLFDYAGSKRVLPVSPTTFYAYLRAILMSFEGQKIEAQAKEILSSLRAIQKDYGRVEENLGILQKHLTNAFNMMGNVFSSFVQLGQKISSTQRLGGGVKEKTKELE
ncbi:MAG: hypothetical protein UT10_C0019G0014 [Candidatus Woesebacteria bacterium GW2011_GWB1_38_8b]|uniref:DNA recombination protein RmuC n=1 Tax=Candidatus Woesebacteria bacterium GW2011_GWB1_38_8b TaxID=1618571 RepID=A0A0G0NLA0_9BACT|nr:MAG: hypothetical protein UT10_C0019G0014 [Candidatus Woesebacteria bacterium GW2011_GWB1_38_8b]